MFVLMDSIITHRYLTPSSEFKAALDAYISAKEAYFKEKGNTPHCSFESSEKGEELLDCFEEKKEILFQKIDSRFNELDDEIKRETENSS